MVLRTTFKPRTENDMTTDKKIARRKLKPPHSIAYLASGNQPDRWCLEGF